MRYREITEDEIREMTRKCSRDYTATCGCLKVLTPTDRSHLSNGSRIISIKIASTNVEMLGTGFFLGIVIA